jgi:hypothetical protein
MQQKTDGRVARLLAKHLSAEDGSIEQWFLVAIGDDDKERCRHEGDKRIRRSCRDCEHIRAATLSSWGMTEGEVRLVRPGEPIGG